MYSLISIIVIATVGVCAEFKLGDFYFFEDQEKSGTELRQRNLFRGQLNTDNSWLSAEMLYDGKLAKNKSILLFKFGEDPCGPNDGIELRNRTTKASGRRPYDGYLLNWSNFKDLELIFSFVHYQSKGEYKGIQLISSYPDYDKEEFPFLIDLPPLSLKETIFDEKLSIDRINGYTSVIDYSLLNTEDVEMDAFFISYLSKSKENMIVTSHSDFENKVLFDNSNATDDIKNPEDIKVNKRGSDFDALVTFKGDNEQDIYYFCDIISRGGLDPRLRPLSIFPRDENYKYKDSYIPYKKQLQASFSHSGDYVSFMNQRVNANKQINSSSSSSNKLFDLYVFDTSYRDEFCEYGNDYIGQNEYYKVDSDIVNVFDFNLPSETAMDYAWHPTFNVIFYVKRSGNDYHLMSYDVDDRQYNTLLSSKQAISYISISEDGEYIVFSFYKLDKTFDNCSDCINDNVTAVKIAVAELIRD